MSSGQWEVVGKNKKEKVKSDKKSGKIEDQNAPSKNAQSNANLGKSPKPGKENKEYNIENDTKKQNKKPNEKKAELTKPKPPKTLDAALQGLNADDVKTFLETTQTQFANAPLVWLKELSSYLNQKTTTSITEDISQKLLQPAAYPASQLKSDVKTCLEKALLDAGEANIAAFYEGTLTAITHDMVRNLNPWGHLIMMQLSSQQMPKLALSSIGKHSALRVSYVNQPPIYKSLLWSIGQAGYKDLDVGLRVWKEVMLPVMELKNYSKFSVSYLTKLLDAHLGMKKSKLDEKSYLSIYDCISSKYSTLNKEVSNELGLQLPKLSELYLKSKPKTQSTTFAELIQRLKPQTGKSLDQLQRHTLKNLSECMINDESCHEWWRNNCQNHVKQSVMLLEYLSTNQNQLLSQINKNSLATTLTAIQKSCLDGSKNSDVSDKIAKLSQEIMASKKAQKSKNRRGFPWLFSIFLVFSGITGLLIFDVVQSGGVFAKSKTGTLLKDLGALETTEMLAMKTAGVASRTLIWVETNAPPAFEKALNVTRPYGHLACDVLVIAKNRVFETYGNIREYAVEKSPIVYSSIDQYAPGVLDTIGRAFCTSRDAVMAFTSHYYAVTKEYLHSKVFIGEWAPEILQDKTLKALNNTRSIVVNYYSWVHEQAHIYSKV